MRKEKIRKNYKNKKGRNENNRVLSECLADTHRGYPLGMIILSFAEDDKLRPGEDVTSATGMKISKSGISKQHIQNGQPSKYQDGNERKKSAKVERKRKHVRKYQKRKKNAMEKQENSAEEKINPIGMLCHLSEKTPESDERRQRPSR